MSGGLLGDGNLGDPDGTDLDALADAAPDIANGTPCDDGRACTVGDLWVDGTCVGGANICPCEPGVLACPAASGDVVNHCRGPDPCVPQPAGAATPFACKPNVALSKVSDASLDDACNHDACDPTDGSCTILPTEQTTENCDLPGGARPAPAAATPIASTTATSATACPSATNPARNGTAS